MRYFIRRSGSAAKNIMPFIMFLLVKTLKRTSVNIGLLLCVGVACDCLADNANLIRNGSFEEEQNGCPTDWFCQIHTKEQATGSVKLSTTAFAGKNSLLLIHDSNNLSWVRSSQKNINVSPNAKYEFQAQVKATGAFSVYCYEFDVNGKQLKTYKLCAGEKSPEWTNIAGGLVTSPQTTNMQISLIAEGLGQVLFDCVSLKQVENDKTVAALKRVTGEITLDGKLDDAFWSQIDLLPPFKALGAKEPAQPKTQAKFATDGENLLVGFECDEPSVENMRLNAVSDGIEVYQNDCVELFINPNCEQTGYYHFVVTPKGFKGGEMVPGKRQRTEWYDSDSAWLPLNKGWQAAGWIGAGKWSVEIKIPLKLIGCENLALTPKWIMNLTRERYAASSGAVQLFTWSYLPNQPSAFHKSEFFSEVVVGNKTANDLTVSAKLPVATEKGNDFIANIPSRKDYAINYWPRPQKMTLDAGKNFELKDAFTITLNNKTERAASQTERDIQALRHQIKSRFNLESKYVQGVNHADLSLILDKNWQPQPVNPIHQIAEFPSVAQQGYQLIINNDGITITANHDAGLHYGIITLRNILTQSRQPQLSHLQIEDWPDYQIRGMQLMSPFDLVTFKKVVDALELLKFNRVWIRCEERLRYLSNPQYVASTAPTAEQLKAVFKYAREKGMDVCPEMPIFSHTTRWIGRLKDETLLEGKGSNINFKNPKALKVTTEVVDYLLEVFETPTAFNITYDEIWDGPLCVSPETKKYTPAQIVAESMNYWDKYIKSKGVKTVYAYGDALRFGAHATGGLPHNTYLARKDINRDIAIADWIYNYEKEYPSLDVFIKDGFRVVPTTWCDPMGIKSFFRAGHERRLAECIGTIWQQQDPWLFCRYPGLQGGIVLNGAYAWNTAPDLSDWKVFPADLFKTLYAGDFPQANEMANASVLDLCSVANITWNEGDFLNCKKIDFKDKQYIVDSEMPFKIDSKLIQLFRKNGPQNLPREINVKINSIAKEICFLQSASAPSESDPQKPEAPTVKIVYADGSNVSIPVRYFSEVVYWNDVKGCAKSRLGVTFKTTENAIVNFYIAKIQNPHPEKTIASINLIAGDASWSLVIAAITITK